MLWKENVKSQILFTFGGKVDVKKIILRWAEGEGHLGALIKQE